MRRPTRALLAHYMVLLNKHGVRSRKADAFVKKYGQNEEFVELAGISRDLKIALTNPHLTNEGCQSHYRV